MPLKIIAAFTPPENELLIRNHGITVAFDKPVTLRYKGMECTIHPTGAKVIDFKVQGKPVLYYDPKDLKHSGIPICFPIFGAISEPLKFDGHYYGLPQHGFIRDMNFRIKELTPHSMTCIFTSTPETFKLYPFHFSFEVSYRLNHKALQIEANISHFNYDNSVTNQNMPFVLAFHPYLAVENSDNILISTDATRYYDNTLKENKKSFTILNSVDLSKMLSLVDPPHVYRVHGNPDLHFTDHTKSGTIIRTGPQRKIRLWWNRKQFPYMTIWRAKPTDNYICVEPATSLKNKMVETLNEAKKGANVLSIPQGASKKFKMSIAVV